MDEFIVEKKAYPNGYIKYAISELGLEIVDIMYDVPKDSDSRFLVIPECIDGEKIISVKPNSLNNLRNIGYAGIIVPESVHDIGSSGMKLYGEYRGAENKKLDIYYSYLEYSFISDTPFFVAYNEFLVKDALFSVDKSCVFDERYFVCLFSATQKRGIWHYPKNGIWEKADYFYRFTGDQDKVNINCKKIGKYAFYKSKVKEIIFDKNCTSFSEDMILDCEELTSLAFNAVEWCRFDSSVVRNCKNLERVILPPKIIDRKDINLLVECPSIKDVTIDGLLKSCYCNDQIYVIEENVEEIGDYAFQYCSSEIIIIPENVKRIKKDAFRFSGVSVVVLESSDTAWQASDWNEQDTYIYIEQDAYALTHSDFRVGMKYNCYLKGIDVLKPYLGDNRELDSIKEILTNNKDKKSDYELIIKEDNTAALVLSKEYVKKYNKKIIEDIRVSPSGTQLGLNYDYNKHYLPPIAPKKLKIDILDTENSGKYGMGLGNGDKIDI